MKIRVKRRVQEVSAVAGIVGHVSPRPKRKKSNSEMIDEMFSSSTQTGGVRISIVSAEKEHAGHVERSKQQGLKNVMEDVEDTLDLGTSPKLDRALAGEEPMEDRQEYKPLYDEILTHNYKLTGVLGQGQFGIVFSAEDLSSGGDYVVKVVGMGENENVNQQDIDRELNNYSVISRAAQTDERMWKHFPETYETWKAKVPEFGTLDLGFIVMEKLVPLTADESAFIPDINYLIARKKPMDAADVNDYGISRDQSKKARFYIINDMPNLEFQIRNAFQQITDNFDPTAQGDREIDELAARLNIRVLKRYLRMSKQDPEKLDRVRMALGQAMLANRGFDMANYYYIMTDEVADAPEAEVILLDLMVTLVKLGKIVIDRDDSQEGLVKSKVRSAIRDVATTFINGYRRSTGIEIGYNKYTIGKSGEGAPGRDLVTAINLLHQKTGLLAKDMHDQNVMKREGGGDIVIVDLGLFRMDPKFNSQEDLSENVTKDRQYRIKLLTKRKK